MGNVNNHLHWFDQSKRKILILCFENYYLKKISTFISKKEIEINDSVGFLNDDIEYKKLSLKFWYLTVNNRHLWKHHFLGTQGLIINFSFQEKVKDDRIIYEVLNVLNDQNIVGIPTLLQFDVKNKDKEVVEKLKKEMNNQMSEEKLNMVKFDEIDFENNIDEMISSFDWLCDNMKPLK